MIKYPRTQGPVGAAPARRHCVKVPEAVKERSQPQGFPPRMIDTCQSPSLRPQSHPHPSFHLSDSQVRTPHGIASWANESTIEGKTFTIAMKSCVHFKKV